MTVKIFDCITFYNANMLFDLRYNVLKDYVDYFVVCEANKTHTGHYKGYNFDNKFKSKYGEKKEAKNYWEIATNRGFELKNKRWVSQLPKDLKEDLEATLKTISSLY